jgi:polar amino acid transport system substrate-binding protein
MCRRALKAALFSTFVTLLAAQATGREDPITVFYYERLPFFGQPFSQDEGFIIQITRLVLDDAKIPYQFEKVPLNRLFENLKREGLFCFPGLFKTPEREATYKYSSFPIYQDAPPRYVIRRSDLHDFDNIHTIKDLLTSDKVLGVVKNYSYGKWVDQNILSYVPPTITAEITDDQSNFILMLLYKRFDFFFSGGEEALYNVEHNQATKGLLAMRLLDDAPAGNIRWIIFPKSFPDELVDRINQSIERVKKSDGYREILKSITRG